MPTRRVPVEYLVAPHTFPRNVRVLLYHMVLTLSLGGETEVFADSASEWFLKIYKACRYFSVFMTSYFQ